MHKAKAGGEIRALVLALVVALTALAVAYPVPEGGSDPPRLTGEIQHFRLERNPRAREIPSFIDAGGRAATLKAFRGKVVVMNFWATWCAPCVREMPALDRLAARFRGRPFALVALNEDREGAAVAEPFLARLGLAHLGLYVDPLGRVQRALGVAGLPTTIVFDAEGRELGRLAAPADWAAPEAVALIEHFLRRAR